MGEWVSFEEEEEEEEEETGPILSGISLGVFCDEARRDANSQIIVLKY